MTVRWVHHIYRNYGGANRSDLIRAVKSKERFIKCPNGVICDTETGLEWLVGPDKDTSYYDAEIWIYYFLRHGIDIDKSAEGGWRFPTIEELKSIYHYGAGSRNMDSIFETTGWIIWSSKDSSSSSSAWYFDFCLGLEFRRFRGPGRDVRAFAARSGRFDH